MASKFGFGQETGVEVDGENPGIVPTKAWKQKKFDERWHTGETLNISIGQGYLLATPLQLAVMTSRIANGGIGVEPTMIKRDPLMADQSKLAPGPIGVSLRALSIARKGMTSVMEGNRGTARRSQLSQSEYRMAGKTGTAQVRRITKSQRDAGLRKDHEKPWVERDHALFVAYAPIDNPAYAVADSEEPQHLASSSGGRGAPGGR